MTIFQDYFCRLPADRKKRLESITRLILKALPDATPSLRYKMPTFEYQGAWLAVASQKNYMSVYNCCPDHIAIFRAKHPEIGCGKSCLNFRDKDPLHETTLREVMRNAFSSGQGTYAKQARKGVGPK